MALKTKRWHLLADTSIPYFEPGQVRTKPPHTHKGRGVETAPNRLRSDETFTKARLGASAAPRALLFTGSRESSLTPEGGCSLGLWGQRRRSRQHFGHLWLVPETTPSGAPGLRGCGGDPRRQFGSNEPLPPAWVWAGGSRPQLSLRSGFRREDAPQGFARPCAVALDGRGCGARRRARLVNQSTQAAER